MTPKKITAEFIVSPDRGDTNSSGKTWHGPHRRSGDVEVIAELKQSGSNHSRVRLSMRWARQDDKGERDGMVWLDRPEAINLAMEILESAFSLPKER
jgi:hypothetical protein